MKKTLSSLLKFLLVALFAFAGIILIGNVGVKADSETDTEQQAGKMVRVSNMKQLQKAINNPDVNVIIFATRERDSFTIKANKNAKEKGLVINAPNASIVNRAEFYFIEIQQVMNYYENVSGNNINLYYNPEMSFSFKVGKNKTVENLTLVTYGTINDKNNCYMLRKGAKVNSLQIAYIGLDDVIFSEFDEDKNEVSIKYTDDDHLDRSYTLKIDSRGRIKRMISDATYKYDYKFKYNKNGYWVKLTGDDDDDKNCVVNRKYNGEYLLNETFECDNRTYEYKYFFYDDSEYRCPYKVSYVIKSQDGYETWEKLYTYDTKNRVAEMRALYTQSYNGNYDAYMEYVEYYYDSNDFAVKDVFKHFNADGEQDEDTETILFEYNQQGDLVKKTTIKGDKQSSETYEYNELGELTGISV